MLDEIFDIKIADTINTTDSIIIVILALILGLVISYVYMKTSKEKYYSKGFILTLIMLPATISIIILLVGNSIARAFSLAGAFSLIRFRSMTGSSKDIAYIFSTLAIGLACGIGYVGYAILFTIILAVAIILVDLLGYGQSKKPVMKLKIVIPENLNFEEEFIEILSKYTNSYDLIKVKTTDFGALYEITYNVELKNINNQKEFIDNLRIKNGNLLVSLNRLGLENGGEF